MYVVPSPLEALLRQSTGYNEFHADWYSLYCLAFDSVCYHFVDIRHQWAHTLPSGVMCTALMWRRWKSIEKVIWIFYYIQKRHTFTCWLVDCWVWDSFLDGDKTTYYIGYIICIDITLIGIRRFGINVYNARLPIFLVKYI